MPPITAEDNNNEARQGIYVDLPVAAATVLFRGGQGAINAAGDVVPATDAAGLKVIGRIEGSVDNSAGAAGDKMVRIFRGIVGYPASETNAPTKANVGEQAYIEDDTILSTDPGANGIVAGEIIEVADLVYVDPTRAAALTRILALENA